MRCQFTDCKHDRKNGLGDVFCKFHACKRSGCAALAITTRSDQNRCAIHEAERKAARKIGDEKKERTTEQAQQAREAAWAAWEREAVVSAERQDKVHYTLHSTTLHNTELHYTTLLLYTILH